MAKMQEFYSVVAKKKIDIPMTDVKEVIRKGRKFLVGKYMLNGKEYEAWRIVGLAKPKTKKKK